jgi:hypothetical protein
MIEISRCAPVGVSQKDETVGKKVSRRGHEKFSGTTGSTPTGALLNNLLGCFFLYFMYN